MSCPDRNETVRPWGRGDQNDSTGPRPWGKASGHLGLGRSSAAAGWLALLFVVGACGKSAQIDPGKPEAPAKTDKPEGAGGSATVLPGAVPTFPSTGVNATTLTVTGIKPATGPFSGGNRAIVRGSGFTEDSLVFVGGRMVQPRDTVLQDRNSLSIVVPAGEAGPAEVKVQVGSDEAARADAYIYNRMLLEPVEGSTAGGTSVLITLDGAVLDADAVIMFGDQACNSVRVISPSQVRCKSPAGSVGKTDVVVSWPEQPARGEIRASDAFEYIDLTDTDQGGLGGGPIDGTINITVVDASIGFAVPGAFVMLGDELDGGDYEDRTDEKGQVTFSGEGLVGPVTVHVAAHCMERVSIVAFDARNITVQLPPLMDPTCGMPGEPSGGGRGTAGSLISGELIFPGGEEFLVNDWDKLPQPRSNELRVAYVFTTRARINDANPNPALSGANARIAEESSEIGENGYPYRIFARPGGMAVYAISGLERRDTGDFTPYLMGVTRNVLTAPGDETTGIDIVMNIPLDHELQVALSNLPARASRGPDTFRVQASIDLGGEGVIVRQVSGRALDVISSFNGGQLFRFFAQPALEGALGDARYQVIAGWYTGDNADSMPMTRVTKLGVDERSEPLTIDDFLSIPTEVAPEEGARIPDDRILRWSVTGTQPDLWLIDITGGDLVPVWTQMVPGSQSESPIPDFSKLEEVGDIPEGIITWSVRAVRIEDFDFDALKYNQLVPRFWSHTSVDSFSMQR